MAISSSLATKVGAASTAAAGVGLGGTYLAWDHITLYAVEREVLEKDLKFVVADPKANERSINIEATKNGASSGGEITLSKDYSWECKIEVKGGSITDEEVKDLASQLKDVLPTRDAQFKSWTKLHRDTVRNILVRACSKQRDDKTEPSKNSKVKGLITLTKEGSAFSFKDHKPLQEVLSSSLSKVEREVIEKDMKLTVSSADQKITVTAPTTGTPALASGQSWTCEFVKESSTSQVTLESTLAEKIKKHLPGDSNINDTQRSNKEELVRSCAKHRDDKTKNPNVKGVLKVKQKEDSTPSFVGYPELDYFFKDVTQESA